MAVRNARIRIVTGCLATLLLLSAGALLAQSQTNPEPPPGNALTRAVPPIVISTNDATRWFRKDFVLFPPMATTPAKTIEQPPPSPPAVQAPAPVESLRRTDQR